jgi:hypothetical protein
LKKIRTAKGATDWERKVTAQRWLTGYMSTKSHSFLTCQTKSLWLCARLFTV